MPKFLIVDDEFYIASILAEIFEDHDYHCEYCTYPIAALQLIRNVDYDLVISDIHMPMLSGVQLLEECMKREPKPCFVFYSASLESNEEFLIKSGAAKLFAKPQDLQALIHWVNERWPHRQRWH